MSTTHGSRKRFWAEAHVDHGLGPRLWSAWTDPSTWHEWDLGLASARLLDPDFEPGAAGEIVDLSGRVSRFEVAHVAADRAAVVVEVRLPAARLVLSRSVTAGRDPVVRHEVAFTGLAAPVFAQILGRRFRPQVGPSLDALLDRLAPQT